MQEPYISRWIGYEELQRLVLEQPDLNSHKTSTEAHKDIRALIAALAERVEALSGADEDTLEQIKEIVAFIEDNKDLIESVTTSKINYTDIADDLETNDPKKVLSAAQGVIIATALSQLNISKLNVSELTQAINTALAQAKASGDFNGSSVSITNRDESSVDDTYNTVTFSDGTSLRVKNGKTGNGVKNITIKEVTSGV